jgi:hypothetical protein
VELFFALILAAVAAGLVRHVLRQAALVEVERELARALTQADFRLQPSRWCEFEIEGEFDHQAALQAIAGTDPLGVQHHCEALLIPETDHPDDPTAVMVAIDGRLVGRLGRDEALEYAERLAELGRSDQIAACPAYIFGGFEAAAGDRAFYGVKLGFAWPIDVEGPPEQGPEVALPILARLHGRALTEDEAWTTPPAPVEDDDDLSRRFALGVGGRTLAFLGWADERIPYMQAVSEAAGLKVVDAASSDLDLLCIGPGAQVRQAAEAKARGAAVISAAQLQQLLVGPDPAP